MPAWLANELSGVDNFFEPLPFASGGEDARIVPDKDSSQLPLVNALGERLNDDSAAKETVKSVEDAATRDVWDSQNTSDYAKADLPSSLMHHNVPQLLETPFSTNEAATYSKVFYNQKFRFPRHDIMHEAIGDSAGDRSNFMEILKYCNNFGDLQTMVIYLGRDFRLDLRFSNLAFQHLLDTGADLSGLLVFLEDAIFNIPEAQNLQNLIHQHVLHGPNKQDEELLHQWLTRQIARGFLSGETFARLCRSLCNHDNTNQYRAYSSRLSQAVLKGLSSSFSHSISEVDASALDTLLETLYCNQLTPKTHKLVITLIKAMDASQIRTVQTRIVFFLRDWVLNHDPDKVLQAPMDNPLPEVFDVLYKLPIFDALFIAARTSEELLALGTAYIHSYVHEEGCRKAPIYDRLKTWCFSLSKHTIRRRFQSEVIWTNIERMIAKQPSAVLASYLQALSEDEQSLFLLKRYLVPKIFFDGAYSVQYRRTVKQYKKLLAERQYNVSPFVLAFHALRVDFGPSASTMAYLFHLFGFLNLPNVIIQLIAYFQSPKYSKRIPEKLIRYQISYHIHTHPHIAYRLFKTTPTLPLESCPEIAEMMILDPRFDPADPFSMLSKRNKYICVTDVQPRNNAELRVARHELFTRMAVAYTQAKHLFLRVAYRYVCACYDLHVQLGLGGKSREMSKALTLTGIIRPLEEGIWVSTTQIKFVLNIVRKVEGEEVAEKLDELLYVWRGRVAKQNQLRRMEGTFAEQWFGEENPFKDSRDVKVERPRGRRATWAFRGASRMEIWEGMWKVGPEWDTAGHDLYVAEKKNWEEWWSSQW